MLYSTFYKLIIILAIALSCQFTVYNDINYVIQFHLFPDVCIYNRITVTQYFVPTLADEILRPAANGVPVLCYWPLLLKLCYYIQCNSSE